MQSKQQEKSAIKKKFSAIANCEQIAREKEQKSKKKTISWVLPGDL